jgi:AraC-like DNA-binding protein
MRFTPVGPWRPAHRQLAELTLAQFAEGVRILTGTEVRPLQVRFVHPAPEDTREHEAVFGAPVVFGAPHNDVELSHEDAARPLVHADAVVNAIFEHQAKQALERLPVTESTAGRVRHQLQRSLAGGDFSFAAIARALHTPERTLQRRLAAEGQSYAALLEGVRRELSTAYLRRSYSIAEVSFLLGYSDPSVFHRAFKRWWGKSPEAFRKTQAEGAARRPPA